MVTSGDGCPNPASAATGAPRSRSEVIAVRIPAPEQLQRSRGSFRAVRL